MVTYKEDSPLPKVLIIDDDEAVRSLIEMILAKIGYQVFTAQNGKEGVALASEVIPDLVLMDITMPDMDGYEATKQMKVNPSLREVPVIFLTGKAPAEDSGRAFAVGGLTYVCKPFTAQQIRDLVSLAIQSR
jgi:CheY-like chemotaxis protein